VPPRPRAAAGRARCSDCTTPAEGDGRAIPAGGAGRRGARPARSSGWARRDRPGRAATTPRRPPRPHPPSIPFIHNGLRLLGPGGAVGTPAAFVPYLLKTNLTRRALP